ncbi:uncharacterized protein BDCG_00405 [Blastomyces dermatitidis ER-3]|uniref:Ilp is an apoptosis inhibitor n=1 Tax=Ajellomyces dermatitidis (strain ER-3 / ATCC MYA-2586) TaxID=559297 RepID=A0ABP2EKC1_AJEDR|nr:uncharacterized protein BDCG_00405 [Blastomyces dermatitidis ER-3]EEQ83600.2 hypothetical protein BDCG_00405 [Blastomyces dermatitidis ER-3]
MSLEESQGRRDYSLIKKLWSSASSPFRVHRFIFRNKSPQRPIAGPSPDPRDNNMSDPRAHFDPAAMVGLSEASHRADDPQFDIFEWYPRYQNCQRYFLDHAQYSIPVQALSAFLNIYLPFQRQPNPLFSSSSNVAPRSSRPSSPPPNRPQVSPAISLVPYIRRLVATGMDFPGVLHGFFGDDWVAGVGHLHEQERRNYLFAAKSGGWASVKQDYDMPPLETIPFLRPLQAPADAEIEAAEKSWSEWLAMEDWMVGPRAPDILHGSSTHSRERSVGSARSQ